MMSIICEGNSWCLIDERRFLNETYKSILTNSHYEKYVCEASTFDIDQQFVCDSQHFKNATSGTTTKKRKRRQSEDFSEAELSLQSKLKEAINLIGYDQMLKTSDTNDNNRGARNIQNLVNELQNVFNMVTECDSDQENIDDIKEISHIDLSRLALCLVSNPHEFGLLKEISSQKYIIPPKSTFLMSDLTRMEAILDAEVLFDCIVVDPPWQNKSVKRKRVYNSMPMFDLKMLPIRNLCAKNCLVVVWVTNKAKLQDYIISELFPLWHVSFHTVWYWMKVTNTLSPVLPLNSSSKKPYEKLVLGFYSGSNFNTPNSSNVPLDMAIISVPSSIHSHKPPLTNVLNKYLPAQAKCLELFARNLQPGWFSWGNEVLLLQNERLFSKHDYLETSSSANEVL